MAKQHDKQFKLDAVQYYQDHKDLGVRGCAENLGIGYSTLTKWLRKEFYMDVLNCDPMSFDKKCELTNAHFHKNKNL